MARLKLTAEAVKGLKHSGKKTKDDKPADDVYWDTETKGFGLKVTPRGAKVYLVQYRLGGKHGTTKRYTIGREGTYRPESARKEARSLLQQVADGVDIGAAKRERSRVVVDLAFDKFAESFADTTLKAEWSRSWQDAKRTLTLHATPTLKGKPLPDITPSDIRGLLRKLDDRKATRLKLFAVLSYMFNRALEDGLVQSSPLAFIKSPAAVDARERTLTDDELRWLWEATAAEQYGDLIRLMILSGQRRSEVAELPWSELSRPEREWHLPAERAKNGTAHVVQLGPQAVALLDKIAGGDKWPRRGLVFKSRNGTAPTGFSKIKARLDKAMKAEADKEGAAVERWTLHDLRRTLATNLQRLGVRFEVVEHLLNHKERARTGIGKVYQRHGFADEKRAALERWEARLSAIVEGSSGVVVPFGKVG